jgi:hypothetical protein
MGSGGSMAKSQSMANLKGVPGLTTPSSASSFAPPSVAVDPFARRAEDRMNAVNAASPTHATITGASNPSSHAKKDLETPAKNRGLTAAQRRAAAAEAKLDGLLAAPMPFLSPDANTPALNAASKGSVLGSNQRAGVGSALLGLGTAYQDGGGSSSSVPRSDSMYDFSAALKGEAKAEKARAERGWAEDKHHGGAGDNRDAPHARQAPPSSQPKGSRDHGAWGEAKALHADLADKSTDDDLTDMLLGEAAAAGGFQRHPSLGTLGGAPLASLTGMQGKSPPVTGGQSSHNLLAKHGSFRDPVTGQVTTWGTGKRSCPVN